MLVLSTFDEVSLIEVEPMILTAKEFKILILGKINKERKGEVVFRKVDLRLLALK